MGAVVNDAGLELHVGDCRTILPTLPAESVQCVVTSPPYWGLRDYGTATWDGGDAACDHARQSAVSRASSGLGGATTTQGGVYAWRAACGRCGARRVDQQLGLEATPDAYVAAMVGVFREVRRVLRADGTLWLNMGDSYATQGGRGEARMVELGRPSPGAITNAAARGQANGTKGGDDLKPKDLVGMPWRLAFALQADGWYLRADIIWAKPNPMPERVTDRPTKAHEYVFLLTKSARYFYDADAVREADAGQDHPRAVLDGQASLEPSNGLRAPHRGIRTVAGRNGTGRNLRSVWSIPSAPFPDAHFATFPPALAQRCLLAGTSAKGCCRACGAPWARRVDRIAATPARDGAWKASDETHRNDIARKGGFYDAARIMIGWAPTCACLQPVDTEPCVVLDCFAGSGTVGQVAEALGRRSILIELSHTYTQMARTRTAQRGLFTAAKA